MGIDNAALNENQERKLRITCQHIDKLLADIEDILNETSSKTPFPRHISDIAPAQRRTIENYIARIRAQLVRVLDGQGISRQEPSIPASRTIQFTLVSIDIALEELKPKYMKGHGKVSSSAATELNGIVGELQGLVTRLNRYLKEGVGEDLRERLQRFEQVGNDLALLSSIEKVVTDQGLVEFRGTIAAILDRAEDKTFEIAVFGRVSSGKSSLLNAILDADILPVGVTPITAVPTRITYGERSEIIVSFTESPPKKYEIHHLGEFASEQQNPGNAKHVTRIVVTIPASRLRDGITFVDTPGLGSLAMSGAAETLAYLPKCDLGVVLVDASSTLTTDDLQTILALQEAAVPVNVLLSKSDILTGQDCERTLHYMKQHISSECRQDLPVHAVSVIPSHRHLLHEWFEDQICPLYSRSQDLKIVSLQRKIGALRESLIAALQIRLRRSQRLPSADEEEIRAIEARLRRATGAVEGTRSLCNREIEEIPSVVAEISQEISARIREAGSQTGQKIATGEMVRSIVIWVLQQRAKKLQSAVEDLALRLQSDLLKSGEDLGLTDIPDEEEFLSLVRGMPVFDLGTISSSISRPASGGFFGRKLSERHLAEQIQRHLQEPLGPVVANYMGTLKNWMTSVTGQLGRKFEMYAERYRAHAEQSLGRDALPTGDIHGIEEDLRFLGKFVPGEMPPETRNHEKEGR